MLADFQNSFTNRFSSNFLTNQYEFPTAYQKRRHMQKFVIKISHVPELSKVNWHAKLTLLK